MGRLSAIADTATSMAIPLQPPSISFKSHLHYPLDPEASQETLRFPKEAKECSQYVRMWIERWKKDMIEAAEDEITIQKGYDDKDGVPFIAVVADGGWSHRSYGHSYTAKSSCAVVIEKETKKILFIGACNKYCSRKDMIEAAEDEITIQKGYDDKDGVPFIAVVADGGWSHRSYGHSYTAKSSCAVVIEKETKKILFIGACNKYCSRKDMIEAAEDEITIQKGYDDKDGVPFIAVVADGGWSHRSYGHSYTAKSSCAVVIEKETKKILFIGACNKYCSRKDMIEAAEDEITIQKGYDDKDGVPFIAVVADGGEFIEICPSPISEPPRRPPSPPSGQPSTSRPSSGPVHGGELELPQRRDSKLGTHDAARRTGPHRTEEASSPGAHHPLFPAPLRALGPPASFKGSPPQRRRNPGSAVSRRRPPSSRAQPGQSSAAATLSLPLPLLQSRPSDRCPARRLRPQPARKSPSSRPPSSRQ
ncbi:unnamed protein product [Bemisia tabaci]|uniref:Mutator-like transposase domain-containing protein n=1 Tax=Bemisia tabaci TaxID=7038 RepID=A0A9P0A5U5_BEMTA|nr:unnamed protein product [Bemisia tabaci]